MADGIAQDIVGEKKGTNGMSQRPDEFSGFDSRDSDILISDGPGDTTVRPPSERLLPFLMSEREKLIRLQALENPMLSPKHKYEEREEKRN